MSRVVVWVAPKFHYKSATVGAREKTSAIAWTRIGKGVVRLALGQSSVLKLYCKSAKIGVEGRPAWSFGFGSRRGSSDSRFEPVCGL